jgi:beta-glucosidase/6-phospho-beta-glucosidase/beta-galactosidase
MYLRRVCFYEIGVFIYMKQINNREKPKNIFPKDFWWGAATSGPQSEGRFNQTHRNVFDYWFDISPDKFFNEVGPNVASNFYNSCFGYHLWTPIDCWSWNNAYKNRYGFISLDLETQVKTI